MTWLYGGSRRPAMLPCRRDARRHRDARRLRSSTVLSVIVIAAQCSNLTEVSAPGVIEPTDLGSPLGAEALRAGAMGSFRAAFAGGVRGQITSSGAMADEFVTATGTSRTDISDADQRLVADFSNTYPYREVQRARGDVVQAIAALQRYSPAARWEIGELFAIGAYTELFLAENMCAGIPLGEIVDGRPVFGTPLDTDALFLHAVSRFDSALMYASDSVGILNLARVGRARALLGANRLSDAAAAASAVPTAFAYLTTYAASAQPNGVFDAISTSRFITVADREGTNGLNFRTSGDPRVPVQFVGKGRDGATDVYNFSRYAGLASSIPLATGVEARLIEAEAALRSGNPAGGLTILNALRTTVGGLAPLTLPATTTEQVDQLFRERAFWLFATGHRHGDLRRLVRQYQRTIDATFPVGAYAVVGQTYGREVTFTPDESQLINPQYKGCQARTP
jgi:hypothetical protein